MARLPQLACGALLLLGLRTTVPAEAAPNFDLTPRLTVVYDSNLARSSEELARLRGLHRSDFRYSPSLGLTGTWGLGRQELFINSDVGYDFHQHNTQLDRIRASLEAQARLRFSRCSGAVTGLLSVRQSDIADFLVIGPVKNTEYLRRLGFDGRCGREVGLVPLFGGAVSALSNSNDLREYSDYTSTEGKLGVAYVKPSFGELSLIGRIRDVRYRDRPDLIGASAEGYDVQSLEGRFERRIGRLHAEIGAGMTHVDPGGDGDEFTGFTGDLSLTTRVTSRIRAHLDVARSIVPATLGAGDYSLQESYAARADYAVSPRVTFGAGAAHESRSTKGEVLLPTEFLRSDKRYITFAKATYQRSARTSADLELRHEVRNAKPEIFDYTSTRATLNLRMTF